MGMRENMCGPKSDIRYQRFEGQNFTDITTVDLEMLQCTLKELDYRLSIVRVTNGVHVEHNVSEFFSQTVSLFS